MAAQPFRTDGGATWLNLLATRGQSFGQRPVERLPDTAAVRDWLTLMGFEPAQPPTEQDRLELLRLREALRVLAMSAVAGRPYDAHSDEIVSRHVLAGHAASAAAPPLVPFTAACAAIATQAVVTLRGPDRTHLKECAESDCRWVFLDPSGRRRWCPNPACANRGRVRAHRAKQERHPTH